MATALYIAIFERAGEGFSVYFPDLPGCTSAGRTLGEAARNAEEALAAHVILVHEDGDVPEPSNPEDIERDPEVEEAARMLVRVDLPGRAQRLNITLDEGLVAAIDKVADNRSAFLARAARFVLTTGVETITAHHGARSTGSFEVVATGEARQARGARKQRVRQHA